MEFTITIPALIFPTISLLLLAYTNRFIAIGNRIRLLHVQYKQQPSDQLLSQLRILKLRIRLIRDLQLSGISSLLLSVCSIFLLLLLGEHYSYLAKGLFMVSLLLLMAAFVLSGVEIVLSIRALNIQLNDLKEKL